MDKIYRFYDKFNPCIFMDHYPANLFAIAGIGLQVINGLGYSMVLMLRLQLVGNVWLTTYSSFVIILVSLTELLVIIIFPANLYAMDGDHHHPVTIDGFHIPSTMNDTAAAVIRDSRNFTLVEVQAISDHTSAFAVWAIGAFVMVNDSVNYDCVIVFLAHDA
jgi:hypothetical protein